MKRPLFIARQSANPRGALGAIVAQVMAHETVRVNDHAIQRLKLARSDQVIDVGTGHGRALQHLASQVPEGRVVGVDHSPLMCRKAARFSRKLVGSGQVRIECADTRALPFSEATFDAALAVHTVYFWQPIEPHLSELARVLRSGGRLVLAFRAESNPAIRQFPSAVYRFRPTAQVEASLRACGFGSIKVSSEADGEGDIAFVVATRVSER